MSFWSPILEVLDPVKATKEMLERERAKCAACPYRDKLCDICPTRRKKRVSL